MYLGEQGREARGVGLSVPSCPLIIVDVCSQQTTACTILDGERPLQQSVNRGDFLDASSEGEVGSGFANTSEQANRHSCVCANRRGVGDKGTSQATLSCAVTNTRPTKVTDPEVALTSITSPISVTRLPIILEIIAPFTCEEVCRCVSRVSSVCWSSLRTQQTDVWHRIGVECVGDAHAHIVELRGTNAKEVQDERRVEARDVMVGVLWGVTHPWLVVDCTSHSRHDSVEQTLCMCVCVVCVSVGGWVWLRG